jgi:hypothetical protein
MLGMKPHNNIVRVLGMCQETVRRISSCEYASLLVRWAY